MQEPREENVLVDRAGSGWLISPPNVRGGSSLEESQEVLWVGGWCSGHRCSHPELPVAAGRAAEQPANDLELGVKRASVRFLRKTGSGLLDPFWFSGRRAAGVPEGTPVSQAVEMVSSDSEDTAGGLERDLGATC